MSISSSTYQVGRPRGVCVVSGQPIGPGQAFMTALRETPKGFERIDVSLAAWDQFDRGEVVGFWRTVMPATTTQKKKALVDDAVLCDLLERLADVQEPAKQSFRFVLALILMRKKLLMYEGQRTQDGLDIWRLRLRGRDQSFDLIDPRPSDEHIAMVREQLGEILNEG